MAKQIHQRMEENMYEALAKYAEDNGMSVQDSISQAVAQMLNKQAQTATEQEIRECQDEVEEEEIRIAASATSYKNIQDWAAKFEGAPLDIKKMILARMIERITVDRDYNIEIHFYVTVDDFDGKVASAS